MILIFIYGPPSVGKLTIGKALAEITGYKLFHNHLTVNLVTSVFPFATQEAQELMAQIRLSIFKQGITANVPGIISTQIYSKPETDHFIKQILKLFQKTTGQVHFVQLKTTDEMLLKRVVSEDRKKYGKTVSPKELKEMISNYILKSKIPFVESLTIDNTKLNPEDCAAKIMKHYRLGVRTTKVT
ncbi:MAG TPA: hypothetical protein ENI23_02505 [bacterium]|nr:hypothetical protein [bacterium]